MRSADTRATQNNKALPEQTRQDRQNVHERGETRQEEKMRGNKLRSSKTGRCEWETSFWLFPPDFPAAPERSPARLSMTADDQRCHRNNSAALVCQMPTHERRWCTCGPERLPSLWWWQRTAPGWTSTIWWGRVWTLVWCSPAQVGYSRNHCFFISYIYNKRIPVFV